MNLKINQRTSEFLLVFGANFTANLPAFFGVIWLLPRMVLAEVLLGSILAAFSIWMLIRDQLITVFLETLKKNWFILPFLIFSGLSIFWSISWEISAYRWLVLIFTVITGGFIGLRYRLQEMLKLLSFFCLFILIASMVLVLFVPDVGLMNYHNIQGAWKGLYWHKNHMGIIATFINILFLVSLYNSVRLKEKKSYAWGFLYFATLFFVYQTDSVAAYITTLFLHGFIILALFWQKFGSNIRRSQVFIAGVVVIVVLLVIFLNLDQIFGIFGRNTSLTGRIPMWAHLYDTYIQERPAAGYGFNAFWYDESHRVETHQAASYPDPIVIADNGFIDLLLNTGFTGLFLFLIFYFGVWWRSIKFASKATDLNGMFPVILMAYTLIANVSWSLIYENESFFMLLMISVLFCISKNELTS